jgi:heat shock protein HtpX
MNEKNWFQKAIDWLNEPTTGTPTVKPSNDLTGENIPSKKPLYEIFINFMDEPTVSTSSVELPDTSIDKNYTLGESFLKKLDYFFKNPVSNISSAEPSNTSMNRIYSSRKPLSERIMEFLNDDPIFSPKADTATPTQIIANDYTVCNPEITEAIDIVEVAEATDSVKPTYRTKPKSLFSVVSRVLAFLAVNFLLFWYKPDNTIEYNFIAASIYAGNAGIMLSPFPEWLYRKIEDVRNVATSTEKERLHGLFDGVKDKALTYCDTLSKDVKLYIVDSMSINAFALGSRTVAITRGLMETMSDEELEGVLAHELAHIINYDSQVSLLLKFASNLYVLGVLGVIKALSFVERITGGVSFAGGIISFVRNALQWGLDFVLMVFAFIVGSANRKSEYKSDRIAFELGFGEGLLSALYKFYDLQASSKKNLIDRLQATHPRIAYRIEALENMIED